MPGRFSPAARLVLDHDHYTTKNRMVHYFVRNVTVNLHSIFVFFERSEGFIVSYEEGGSGLPNSSVIDGTGPILQRIAFFSDGNRKQGAFFSVWAAYVTQIDEKRRGAALSVRLILFLRVFFCALSSFRIPLPHASEIPHTPESGTGWPMHLRESGNTTPVRPYPFD